MRSLQQLCSLTILKEDLSYQSLPNNAQLQVNQVVALEKKLGAEALVNKRFVCFSHSLLLNTFVVKFSKGEKHYHFGCNDYKEKYPQNYFLHGFIEKFHQEIKKARFEMVFGYNPAIKGLDLIVKCCVNNAFHLDYDNMMEAKYDFWTGYRLFKTDKLYRQLENQKCSVGFTLNLTPESKIYFDDISQFELDRINIFYDGIEWGILAAACKWINEYNKN